MKARTAELQMDEGEKCKVLEELHKQPLSQVTWMHHSVLSANDYNPNHVFGPEMKLLKLSMLKQGWIQPVLVCKEGDGFVIIDGFHRSTLTKRDEDIQAMTNGMVPCVILDIDRKERMLLTVRINRAKGSHAAVKMHELVSSLVEDEGCTVKEICKGIGADSSEVKLLLQESVFKKLNVENTDYSEAWCPK